jgi:type II secretory pathway component PulK
MTTVESKWFQVLAKIDYQTSTYFMRAYISRNKSGELPEIRSIELF